jgi:hypothetical protein
LLKAFRRLVWLAALVAVLAACALWYAAPASSYGLSYGTVPFAERASDMVRRMSAEMELSEADVNNLLVAHLARNPEIRPGIVVTGAAFHLAGDRLLADVNVKVKERIPVGLHLEYRLDWQSPDLIFHTEKAAVRSVGLPLSLFPDQRINLAGQMPKPLKIRDVRLQDGRLIVQFRKPTLQDLQQLL